MHPLPPNKVKEKNEGEKFSNMRLSNVRTSYEVESTDNYHLSS